MWLKIIACILMFFDHYAHLFSTTLSPELYFFIRLIGRLSFPAFAYLIVVGMRRSRDVRRYLCRLLFMALVTQGLFILTERIFQIDLWTNVLFTFAFALIGLIGIEFLLYGWPDMSLVMRPVSVQGPAAEPPGDFNMRVNLYGLSLQRRSAVMLGVFCLSLCFFLTWLLQPDYDIYGIISVFIFYFFDSNGRRIHEAELSSEIAPDTDSVSRSYMPMFLVFLIYNLLMSINNLYDNISVPYSFLQAFSSFAVPLFPLAFTGQRPGFLAKYAFYFFYPLHIVLLVVLRHFLI